MFVRRWSLRSKAMALLAVLGGAGSFTLVRGYAAEVEVLRPAPGDVVPVVVAGRDLARGTVIDRDAVVVDEVPSAYAPPGALRTVEDAVGRTLGSDLVEGEAVTRTRVGGAGGPVASLVATGLRAFVVGSGLPSGVLEPGDRVDVIATFGGPSPYTDTVGSGLQILSIVEQDEETFQAGGATGPSLVLLVSPETAEQLAHSTAFGQITVTIARSTPPDDRRDPSRARLGCAALRRELEGVTLTILQAIVLGITQGVTEFAPISSSGHLIVVPWLFDWPILADPNLNKTFDVALHLGTLAGAVVYFRHDVVRYAAAWFRSISARRIGSSDERLAWALVVGTIPAIIVGATLEGFIQEELGQPWLIAVMLVAFGVVLYAVDRIAVSRRHLDDLGVRDGLVLGIAQALALQPGVSRSGVTMTAARVLTFDRETAARFSFLLSLPVIAGAVVYKGLDLLGDGIPPGMGGPFVAGIVASAVSGFLVIAFLLKYLRAHDFALFLWFRVAVAVLIVVVIASGARPATI